jgi:hypothetical protein
MDVEACAGTDVEGWCAVGGVRKIGGRRRLEGLGTRKTLFHAGKVYIPRGMNGLGILPPETIHFVGVIRVGAIGERIVG